MDELHLDRVSAPKHYLLAQFPLNISPFKNSSLTLIILFKNFLKDFIYLILERGEGREKERKRNINVWLPLAHPNWGPDLACNPGMCPDCESNQPPFGSQASTQSTEPHESGLTLIILTNQ